MFDFRKREHTDRIDQWVQGKPAARFLTSHVSLVFFYGIFLFLYEMKILRELVPVVHPFLIAWAGALAVYDVLARRLWEKLPYWPLLALFAVAAGVTAVVNRETGLVSNLKSWVMVVLPLVAFLPVCFMQPREQREKALLKTLMGAAVVVFLASAAALVLYLLRVSGTVTFMGMQTQIGYRYYIINDPTSGLLLYGLYEDTNHAASYAIVFAAYSLMLLNACRKGLFRRSWQNKLGQVFAIANMVVQLCYFPLANSRGGWLCLAAACGISLFLYCYFTKLKHNNKLLKAVASAGIAVLCTALLCGSLLAVRSGFSAASNLIANAGSVGSNQTGTRPEQGGSVEAPERPDRDEFEGKEEHQGDSFAKQDDGLGSGRIKIWKESLQLFTRKPVLGTGPDNSTYFADRYEIGELIRYGSAMHNSYIDLLVDYGVIGFAVLISFWAACLWAALRHIGRNGKTLGLAFWMTAFVVLFVAGTAMFLSCTFINTTAMYLLLLTFASYLMAQCRDKGVKA